MRTTSLTGPGYPWRGLSLDIARSFFPPAVLHRVIDRLADLGLNVLHLHLTDDQGWRLEIPAHPALAQVSGQTAIRGGQAGYLSLADWAELVDHAARRAVVIVPEIDLPGHVHAALHACPELNGNGVAPPPCDQAGVWSSHLRADLAATEPFLRDVLGTVAAVTPGPWLHIGGDECLGLAESDYVSLLRLIVGIVEELGKTPVAWQEAALADLGPRVVLQFWMSLAGEEAFALPRDGEPPAVTSARRSRQALVAQARRGAKVILSPARSTYFDMKHHLDDTLGATWAGAISLDQAGGWDPRAVLPDLDEDNILGVEAALWTELIHSEADLDAMLWPRLARFAEVARRPTGR
jgi:hexosaminidase